MGFDNDPCIGLNTGDEVELSLAEGVVKLRVISRVN
jgi:hypothetical protein